MLVQTLEMASLKGLLPCGTLFSQSNYRTGTICNKAFLYHFPSNVMRHFLQWIDVTSVYRPASASVRVKLKKLEYHAKVLLFQ